MSTVGIVGVTGFGGEELLRSLLRHPRVRLAMTTASPAREEPIPLTRLYPWVPRDCRLVCEPFDLQRVIEACEVVFLALPHGTAMDLVPPLLEAGRRVIDVSGDFRLRDPALYPRWYGMPHRSPQYLAQAVYGLTELNRPAIRTARLVANPGCYATSAILACAPFIADDLLGGERIIVDAKSGRSGAGRQAQQALIAETTESVKTYKVNEHQHAPEILQALYAVNRHHDLALTLVPHVVPINRGILSTVYLSLRARVAERQVREAFERMYANEPFVRLAPAGVFPQILETTGTNVCALGLRVDPEAGQAIVVSVLDNLTKGAAGQAVQNLNVMCGWPETDGLK